MQFEIKGLVSGCSRTYISKILKNVVMGVSLFIFVAGLLDSFLADESFFDFRPHAIFFRFLSLEAASSVSHIDDSNFTGFFHLIIT